MAVFLFAAGAVGAREAARLDYLADSLPGEVGVGMVALVYALALAGGSVLAGRGVDTRDARPVLVGSMVLSGALAGGNAWVLTRGAMPVGWLLASTALEAALLGAAGTSLLKIQAALVPTASRGAAETVNIVRIGLGVAAGTVVAGILGEPVAGLTLAAVLLVMVGLATAAVTWSADVPRATGGRVRMAHLVENVRARPALRATILVDLALAVVLPTQFIALVVTDQQAPELATLAFTASLLGLLLGRLALLVTGIDAAVARRLRVAYLTFAALLVAATPSLVGGWVLDYPALVAALLFVGSALMAFSQNVPLALLQQQVPEEIRGSLSGAMNAARNLLIAGTALSLSALTHVFSSAVLTAALGVLLVAGYLVTGQFRGIGASTAAPAPVGDAQRA